MVKVEKNETGRFGNLVVGRKDGEKVEKTLIVGFGLVLGSEFTAIICVIWSISVYAAILQKIAPQL